jgi:Mg2+/citrate symporter
MIQEYSKFVAALLGAIAVSFAGLIPESYSPWIQAVIALAAAVSVLVIPNRPRVSE